MQKKSHFFHLDSFHFRWTEIVFELHCLLGIQIQICQCGSSLKVKRCIYTNSFTHSNRKWTDWDIIYFRECIKFKFVWRKMHEIISLCGFNYLMYPSKLLNHVMIILIRATTIFSFFFFSTVVFILPLLFVCYSLRRLFTLYFELCQCLLV